MAGTEMAIQPDKRNADLGSVRLLRGAFLV